MHAVSTFLIAIGFVLSANAAAVHSKRAVSSPVQMCIDNISAINTQLTSLDGFNSFLGLIGVTSIIDKEKVLEDKLKKASTDCCAIPTTTVTDEEATSTLKVVGELVPQVNSALASITKQKSQSDFIPPAAAFYKTAIIGVSGNVEALIKCLVVKTPSGSLATANDNASQVNSAIAEAKKNF